MASDHHFSHSLSLFVNSRSGRACPGRFPYQLCQEVTFHTLQEPPRLSPLHCAVLPADTWQVKISHKNKG